MNASPPFISIMIVSQDLTCVPFQVLASCPYREIADNMPQQRQSNIFGTGAQFVQYR